MRVQKIDILSDRVMQKADAICFTSNGIIKKDGRLVMGAGVAKIFRDRFKDLDLIAGKLISTNGNICQIIADRDIVGNICPIISFPTKNHWRHMSDILLIKKSATELMSIVQKNSWSKVALSKPGCANGGLNWNDVSKVLEQIFDDRIVIVYL